MKKSRLALIAFAFLISYSSFSQGITLFWDENWNGASLVINENWDAGTNLTWNDQISSIKVPVGYKIQVFEHQNFGGASKILTGDWTINGLEFNDMISSIKFLEFPRPAPVVSNNPLCCDKELPLGGSIESGNKKYFLVFQNDRNLVVYKKVGNDAKPLWASSTNNRVNRCVMQADGNLVLYNDRNPIWSSNTYGNPNAKLYMQDDGNLVIYNAAGKAIWASNTAQPAEPEVSLNPLCCDRELAMGTSIESGNGLYFLAFQNDRNLVVYKKVGNDAKPLWASATNNRVNRCVMQADGNFVLYNDRNPIWSSNTYGNPNAKLYMQDDGNLVIYNSAGKAIWATNTNQPGETVVAPVVIPVVAPVVVQQSTSSQPCSMPEQSYQAALKAISAQSFKDGKLQMSKQAIKNKCLSLDQIRGIAKLFDFEDSTLDFIKYAYDFNNDKDEYYTLSDVFTFNSNTENFMKFLETKGGK